jgi:hypothetical protein
MELLTWARAQWDRIAAWVLVAVGSVALLVGWVGVSQSSYTAQQVPYLMSGGVGALFLVGLGAAMWLSADLRDEWRKLDIVEDELREIRVLLRGLKDASGGRSSFGNNPGVGAVLDVAQSERIQPTDQHPAHRTAGAKA